MSKPVEVRHVAYDWRKLKGILGELVSNSFQAGATLLESKIEDQGDRVSIYVKDNGHGMSKEILEKARKLLSYPRRHELEEYYGNLAGKSVKSSGLSIIGMMTDDFEIQSEKGLGTEVCVIIYKDSK